MRHQIVFCILVSLGLGSSVLAQTASQHMKSQEATIERLKAQNMVLNKRMSRDFKPSERKFKLAAKNEIKKLPPGERPLYAFILNKYRAKEETAMSTGAAQFLKKYPNSPFADNIIYLQGMLLFESQKYGPAVKKFQQVIDKFPNSNKRVSAMFAKGATYKQLSLPQFAAQAFQSVVKQYPGSQEFFRSKMELRMLGPTFTKSAAK